MLTILSKPLRSPELLILEFIAKFGVVAKSHLSSLFQLNSLEIIQINTLVRSLVRRKLIIQHQILLEGDIYLTLASAGAQLFNQKSIDKLSLLKLNHDMLLIEIYFIYRQQYTDTEIITEYELKRINGIKVGEKKKVPDLLINDLIAIELELTEKSHARLVEIINYYILDTSLKQVIYYVKSKSLAKKILNLSGSHPKLKVFMIDSDTTKFSVSPYLLNVTADSYIQDFDINEYLTS